MEKVTDNLAGGIIRLLARAKIPGRLCLPAVVTAPAAQQQTAPAKKGSDDLVAGA
ncbi:hypothetical protein ACLH1Z_19740 [Enterobacter hormaechei]|uniref:hypothetical protein n=1 Tax=Enterobacter hormaechei TaxID=158836 RepID=UPI003983AECC